MKKFYCLNGLPRSGSTLLANLLNQNPKFWASPTSGLCPLLLRTNQTWNEISELRASASSSDKMNVLRGMLESFHVQPQPSVFDKSRGWVCAFELLGQLLGYPPKIIVTYRDIPSILSSCEKLFRRELANPASTAQWAQGMETIEGRLAHWTAPDQLVGGSYNRIRDCVQRGHREHMHFVNFDELTAAPGKTLREIYDFLGEDAFVGHDVNNVVQSTHEKDAEHGFVDLHTIRPEIRPMKKDFKEVLGDAIKPYLHISYDFI
jgi:sulfotransferase